jgi:hypothetical protein
LDNGQRWIVHDPFLQHELDYLVQSFLSLRKRQVGSGLGIGGQIQADLLGSQLDPV